MRLIRKFKMFFQIRVNASRGQRGQKRFKTKLPSANRHHTFQEELKRAKEQHRQKRSKERDQLEEGSASNREFLEALDEKECVFEIQAMILGKLAAEENKLKGLIEDYKIGIYEEPFNERVRDVVEALSILKY